MSALPAPSLRRDLGLVAWQIRYEQRAYWRNRGRGIFTFVFPLMFLVIFASLNRAVRLHSRGGIPYDGFFVPGILAYAIIATTYVNMAISTAILRDEGVLKRMQGTALPRWAYVAARIGSTVLIVGAITMVTLALGSIAYGVQIRVSTLPGLIATLVLGTAAFTALALGIKRVIPNAEAAPVVVRGDEVVGAALASSPDVALLDIEMPGATGLEAATELRRSLPTCRVLIVTTFGRPGYLRRAMEGGAAGFLLKDAPATELACAIRRAASGERVVDPGLAAAALSEGERAMTAREHEVLAASRQHATVADIAPAPHLSPGTVRNHLSSVMRKLDARNRAEAVRLGAWVAIGSRLG